MPPVLHPAKACLPRTAEHRNSARCTIRASARRARPTHHPDRSSEQQMRPIRDTAPMLTVNGFVAVDNEWCGNCSQAHEHAWPFLAVVLAGGIEKDLGSLDFDIPASGAYVMPAELRHRDRFPAGTRIVTLEIDPASEIADRCGRLLARLRRLRGPTFGSLARELATELHGPQDDVTSLAVEGLALELVGLGAPKRRACRGAPAPAGLALHRRRVPRRSVPRQDQDRRARSARPRPPGASRARLPHPPRRDDRPPDPTATARVGKGQARRERRATARDRGERRLRPPESLHARLQSRDRLVAGEVPRAAARRL